MKMIKIRRMITMRIVDQDYKNNRKNVRRGLSEQTKDILGKDQETGSHSTFGR